MKDVLFSIVIPTLNEEKYISGILDDLSIQGYKNFEVIVVDGNSKDDTKKIVLRYKSKIPLLKFYSVAKRNVSYQRNFGAEQSKGKYIIFIDADTRIDKYFLKELCENLNLNPPDLFSCWFNAVSKKTSFHVFCYITSLSYWLLYKMNLPSAPGCLMGIKKEVFDKVGGFSEKIEFAEDRDLVRRCYRQGYNFRFYFKPKYSMSLRRVERIGILKHLYLFILVNIKRELGLKIDRKKEYPMGGATS
jgi:hypothetical protein